MSARRPVTVMAALVAASVVALLAGLLLAERARREVVRPPEPAAPAPAAGGEGRDSVPGAAPPPSPEPPAATPAAPEGPVPAGRVVRGRAVTPEGDPVPGIRFFDMERLANGEIGVFLEEGPNEGKESDAEGRFTLEWTREPEEVLFLVMGREMEVTSAGNGALLERQKFGEVVQADPGGGELRLVLEPAAGFAAVRLVDAEDGSVLGKGERDLLWWFRGLQGQRAWDGKVLAGGWRPMVPPPGPLAGETGEDGATPPLVLEIAVDGYARERIPEDRVRGRMTLPLRRIEPSVTGTLVVRGSLDGRGDHVETVVVPAGDGERPSLRGLPRRPGWFALYDLPDGEWVLEARATTGEGFRWGRRSFQRWGGTVDLGEVEVDLHAGLRVRVLDATGRILAGVPLTLSRPGRPGGDVHAGQEITFVSGGGVIVRTTDVSLALRERSEHPPVLVDGWRTYTGLLPGATYRVAARTLPDLAVEVETPSVNGGVRDVELRWTRRLVRCTFRLTYRGEAAKGWGTVFDESLLNPSWSAPGVLTAELPPGRHRISVLVAPEVEGRFFFAQAEVEIPDLEVYDAAVDLR